MLKGKKVLLRPVKRSDLEFFLKWLNDPEVIQYISLYLPMTEMAEEKWIEELGTTRKDSDAVFIIEAIMGDESISEIGNCGLHNINKKNRDATFGIVIGNKDYWGEGYGIEAAKLIIDYGFNQLNLHRISSSALSFNERSIKMHKKVGFQEEGRCRKAKFKNGQFRDLILFGLLKEEWEGID
jgi:RimJ/RimL family protein N-acetyltransferase